MEDVYDIGDVARRTGLTHRALRFYEARGLVQPLRSDGGRRLYGRGELARLNAIVALRRAGFPVARIADMLGRRPVDLGAMVAAQIAVIDAQALELAQSRALLHEVQSRIGRGEPIDVATLCSLIEKGRGMTEENWKAVVDRYYTPEQQAEWKARWAEAPADFDPATYHTQWRALSDRIAAALPLDPASDMAQAFVDEWFALLKPFSEMATPTMWEGARGMYDRMPEWQDRADPGFSFQVWEFIRAATAARVAAGGTIDGPAWMQQGKA